MESMVEELDNKRDEAILTYKFHVMLHPGLRNGVSSLAHLFNLKSTALDCLELLRPAVADR